MNAIDLLKEDHDAVDQLFTRCESTSPSKHEGTIRRIKAELETHAHIEEKIFYPACRQRGSKELRDIVAEGLEEHAQMKKFLKEIARSKSTEKREAKLKVLMEDTRHHVKEEEDEMFPMAKGEFSNDELEALGERMEAEKKKFQKAKGIRPRRAQPPKGIVATVLDAAKSMVAAVTGPGDGNGQKPRKTSRSKTTKAANGPSSSAGKDTPKEPAKKSAAAAAARRS